MQNSFVFPSLLALLVCAAAPVSAQSVTPARDGTGTVITRDGDRYVITGGRRSGDGANLFQSFERLGLNANEIATFMTQPGIANILGRVTGGDASIINGLLQVSGGNSNLYLINPAGILFGANARLDIPGSFTATTASGIGFGNSTFNAIGENSYADLVGTPDSYAFTLSQPGAIANAGDLAVNPGESLSLIGGVVVNTGTLSAPGGTVTVAAIPGENRVRVSQDGALLSIELESMGANATNPIPFTPLSLPELLTGGDLGSATSLTVDPDGTVRLAGAVIPDIPGTAVVSGVVDAAGAPSGEINVLGDRVALLSANLNASGLNGGGTIRIGGDYQGQGTVFNASNALVSADSVLAADALTSGNGGRVIVWSDDSTQFAGTVTARGGTQNGNGGFVETSGRQTLDFTGGQVNASATNGLAGLWFLDPSDITINAVQAAIIQNSLAGGTGVTLTTVRGVGGNGDITLTSSINATATNNATLQLTASRYISNGGTSSTINLTNGNLILDLNQEGLAVPTNPTLTNAIATIGTISGNGTTNGITTINVGAGTYREQNEVVISRSMTINGIGSAIFDGDRNADGTGDHRVFSIGIGTTVNLNNLTILNGNGSGGAGGGIYNGATLTLTNSTLFGNTTSNSGGGIFGASGTTTTVTNSTLIGNTASIDGGGINHFGTLTLSNSTVSNNTANGSGGGIFGASGTTTTVTNSTLTGNTASIDGGGINHFGTLTLSNSTVSNNIANGSGSGGGIFGAFGTTTTVTNSTFTGNRANNAGGGIAHYGLLTFSNSTLSSNTSGFNGGGIFTAASGTLNLNNSTVFGNTAGSNGGGIINFGTFRPGNSIIAGNNGVSAPDVAGGLTSQGNNLIGDITGSTGWIASDLQNVNPLLSSLGDYGGTTQTHALLPGSPAINAGGAGATTIDQRGIAAVDTRDIGAFESRGFTLTTTGGTPQTANVTQAFATPLSVTVQSNEVIEPVAGGVVTFSAPGTGTTATLDTTTATINDSGLASVTATANDTAGSYVITASTQGAAETGSFNLTNESPSPTPVPTPVPTPSPTPSPSPTPVGCIANCANTPLSQPSESSSSASSQPNVADPEVVQTKLLNIELQTGVTPVLIYISFAPTGLAGRNDLPRQDAIATQQVTDYLNRESPVASVLTAPSRDDDQLELLLVLSDGNIIRRPVRGVTRAMVADKNSELLRAITSPYFLQSTRYLGPAQELYQWLIAPIKPELDSAGIQNLSFVVDTGLRAVPMAVLHDGEQFLVEKYSIGMMPSLSLTDTRYQDIRDLPVLAMGASQFNGLANLPAVPLELATIASEFHGSVQFLNDGFTIENLLKERRDRSFGIVHLATHAVFNPGELNNSFIQLGDRRLGLDQLRQLQFNNPPVELLVLSACETALGDPSAELGFGGLAVQAGVRTVLASLWSVSDTGTLGFMSEFYHQLRSAPTRSEALRQTQLAMLRGEIRIENGQLIVADDETIALTPDLARDADLNFRHPYYWAAFTMIGNPW